MSASKNQRLNLFDNDSPKITSLDNVTSSAKASPKPSVINSKPLSTSGLDSNVRDIETLIAQDRKKSIEDILDVEKEQRPSTSTRRQNSQEKEVKHYSVDSSSIAGKGKKGVLGSGR